MKMPFCPNCQKLMKIAEGNAACICGFKRELRHDEKVHSEKITKKIEAQIKASEVNNENADYPHKCSKCGFDKAEIIMSEPWYSDADQNVRYKCGKCGNVERERLTKT